MKKLMMLAFFGLVIFGMPAKAQIGQKCGTQLILQNYLNAHPEYIPAEQHHRLHLEQLDEAFAQHGTTPALMKTTAVVTIPVVFHVIVTQLKLNSLGGENGVRQRMLSQIGALNKDFGGMNSDSVNIPAAFKPLFNHGQIQFAPAHRTPANTTTEGFEIKITTTTNFSANSNFGSDPKSVATGGLDAWQLSANSFDYLNIWIVDIAEAGILGYTIPPSFIANSGFQYWEAGVVIDFGAFGKRTSVTQFFSPSTNDLGRTATHEVGHYFELQHVWGDDGGLCPTNGGWDDGIADTPPQASETFNSSGNCPQFPLFDACTSSGNGIMWMNYMDYVDDKCMYMFTNGQGNRMNAQVAMGGMSYSLTQHPELLQWPAAIAGPGNEKGFDLFPNPSAGIFQISLANTAGLQRIRALDITGREVYSVQASAASFNNYTLDLTGQRRGVYMVQCIFADGVITRKIILQ